MTKSSGGAGRALSGDAGGATSGHAGTGRSDAADTDGGAGGKAHSGGSTGATGARVDASLGGDAGQQSTDSSVADSGKGESGAGDRASTSTLVNRYDGTRATTVSFDLGWKFKLGEVSGGQNPTLDDSSWAKVDVPHDWSISLPFNQSSKATYGGGYLDGGLGWYRKEFTVPASSAGRRLFIQFDGVYMDSTVWVNGAQVCGRPYGYSSFECDITSSAKVDGANVVAVRVNNQLPSSRWYSGSGIYRHVWLKTVDPVRVAYTGTKVTTPKVSSTSATVDIAVTVRNDAASAQTVSVKSSIRDPAGVEVATASSAPTLVAAGKTADVSQSATVSNPKLWSPSSPSLYSLVTTVAIDGRVVDTYETPFGIRSFAFDASTGFSLNGSRLKLNGVCLHHDLGALGAAVNHRAIEKRLQMLKEMGANAIRTSHNPPAPELLDIADRLGFLVVDEAFDTWYSTKTQFDYGRFFRQWAQADIGDMVARDRNHPGVIVWSIGNEVFQTDDTATVKMLMEAVRAKDATRPIGQAVAHFTKIDTDAIGLEDVVGINYAPERYDAVHQAHPTWKIFASESSSALRSRGVYSNKNTQCTSYDDFAAGWGHTAETSWKNVNTRPWIAGEFIWTGFDYIGEPTPYEWPAKSSYFGAIDTANFPKDAYYFYQSKWNAAGPPMVHVVPMDWTSWSQGQTVKVLVYTNAEGVELFLNGKSLGSKTMDPAASKLQWSVPFAPGTLEAKATKGAVEVASDKVQTAGAPAALRLRVDRPSIAADGRDLAFVEVEVLDAQGVLVPQASNTIDFALEGPATLVGVDNGNAISHESYKGTSRAAFSGKALAMIQSTTSAGTVRLKATSGSLTSASVVVTTQTP